METFQRAWEELIIMGFLEHTNTILNWTGLWGLLSGWIYRGLQFVPNMSTRYPRTWSTTSSSEGRCVGGWGVNSTSCAVIYLSCDSFTSMRIFKPLRDKTLVSSNLIFPSLKTCTSFAASDKALDWERHILSAHAENIWFRKMVLDSFYPEAVHVARDSNERSLWKQAGL